MKFDLKKPEDRQPKKWDKPRKELKKEQPVEQREPRMEREFTIRLNPKKMLKGFFVIALLLGVFFAGRLSVPGESLLGSTGPSSAATTEKTSLDAQEVVQDESTQEPVENTSVETAPADDNTTEAAPADTQDEPKDEPVVTTYDNVALTLTDVGVDWKDTWGKISSVTYSLKNDEDGTVKPDHFTMLVHGYPVDEPGQFEVPYTSESVKSHSSIQDSAIVYAFGGKTKGFSYSPSEPGIGDINSVEIKLFLWDKDNNLIGHSTLNADLSG